jgi:competence protein ComEC
MAGIAVGILSVGLWPQLPPPVLALLLLPGACLVLLPRCLLATLVAGLCFGIALGWWHAAKLVERRLPVDCVGKTLSVEGRVSSLPRHSEMRDGTRRQRFEFAVTRLDPAGCAGPQRLLLSYYGPELLVPGEHWRFPVRVKRPWGLANPGSFNLQAWFAQTGIDGTGSVSSGPAVRLRDASGPVALHHRLRQAIAGRIEASSTNSEVVAALRAVTVADKSGIDGRFWTLLQQLGISHLMVISGLHVGLVAGVTYVLAVTLLRLVPGERRWRQLFPRLAALCAATAYTALAGFSLPTLRALCMLGCFVLADLAGRRGGAWTRLAAAALVLLVVNPLAGLGSGFWLSFGAVAALLWFGQWRRSSLAARLGGTHLFMSLAMVPLGAWWFGGASLVSAAANFLMIPLVGFLVVPPALAAAVLVLLESPLESRLWRVAGWPLAQVLPLAHLAVEAGSGWLYLPLHATLPALLLAVLGVLLWAVPCAPAYRCLALLLCLPLALPPSAMDGSAPGYTRLTVLDVGQGTAALLESGTRALLYDTGGGDPAGANMARSVILPYLRTRGIRRLDTLVVSHPDLDHASGVADILRALAVDRQYYGGSLPAMPQGRPCIAGKSWRWPDGTRFRFLSPARETGLASNDASCVLAVETAGRLLLLTGDIGVDRERELVRYWEDDALRADWLLAAHHGSRTSSGPTFLKHVRPPVVVVSHGYANRFGHPHPTVMQRLRDAASAVYSTAEEGALVFQFAPGKPIKVEAHRWRQRRYWM